MRIERPWALCGALVVAATGCQQGGSGGGDDDDFDLDCGDAEVSELGWDEQTGAWSATAGEARDVYDGDWVAQVTWDSGEVHEVSLWLQHDDVAMMTTYPDPGPGHPPDSCLDWASFPLSLRIQIPELGVDLEDRATTEVNEFNPTWELFGGGDHASCGDLGACTLSLVLRADPDHFEGIAEGRLAIWADAGDYEMDYDDDAVFEKVTTGDEQ